MEQPKELNLANIFSGVEYIIPIYQRSYAWEKYEIEQLLDDIFDFKDKNDVQSKYYLGSLIVDNLGNNQFSVIDGQQRLTTIFLLFAFLRTCKQEIDGFSEKSLTFEARDKSNRTLKALLDGKREETNNSLYTEELNNGFDVVYDYFKEKIEKTGNKDIIQSFVQIFNKILIIRTQVPKDIDLNHYFEVMNTRGEQLEIHEIAKGKITGAITDPLKRKIAAEIWDNCSQMDKYIQMTFKPIALRDSIFGENWDSFNDYNCFNDIYKKIEIFRKEQATRKDTDKSEFSLREKLENPIINNNSDDILDQEENQRFESIISFPNFLLVVNEALTNETITKEKQENDETLDDKKFLNILDKHWASEEKALSFIFAILKYRFIFDTSVIKREYAKDHTEDGKWTLNKLISVIDEKRNNVKKPYYDKPSFEKKQLEILTLQSALRVTYTSPKTMHWISKALTSGINILNVLEDYACNKVYESKYHKVRGFGFERIVFTYLDYMLFRDRNIIPFMKDFKLNDYQFMYRTSIEHFFPQNPLNGSDWKEKTNDPLNSFGNLALITVSANSKFTNLNPSSKIKEHMDIIKQSPKLMWMKALMEQNNNEWTPELVFAHEEEMFARLDQELITKGIIPIKENRE